ncbi:DUF6119 family protein [Pontibacter beigongshangensis]|uniref:DUF6119 family protein n=1 Tax=Pontibacter beigongshangensis TaxID=2574733 RepID=UPI0016505E67|nr:DUF6119 family protein [Pontibacter beigongshangensis]
MIQTPKIYRIDKSHRLLREYHDAREIIFKIISTSYKKLGFKNTIKADSIKSINKDDITYFLHLFNTNDTDSDWKDFLPQGLSFGQNFKQQKLSLILFSHSENELFCTIGGNAYQIIVPFIDHSFGLNMYARIMKPDLDQLASIKSRGLTGARAGLNEQFRDNYRIIDFVKFGKLPQEIHLKLSNEISNLHFGFLQKREDERIQIYVGKSFKVKRGVTFEELHKIINEFRDILQIAPSDYLSSYKEITDQKIINESFKPILIDRLYNDAAFIGRPETARRFEFDFCNPNEIERFYEADSFILKEKTENGGYATFSTVTDRNEIYDTVLRRTVEKFGNNDRFNFMVYLQGVKVTCYKDGRKTISSNFLFHFTTEFSINQQPIFLVDTKWYRLRDSFVKDLNINAQHILRIYKAPPNVLTEPWDKTFLSREGSYNLLYNNKLGYIVIDTIIADGLELCDILHYDENNLYLIHVKYGFSTKMRELTNQILISARRLRENLGTKEKELLNQIYSKLVDKGYDFDGLNLDEFKNLFNKKISFVIAFTSHLKDDLKVEDNMDRFDSNIARFQLIQCSGEMRANYYDLLTHQIMRQ